MAVGLKCLLSTSFVFCKKGFFLIAGSWKHHWEEWWICTTISRGGMYLSFCIVYKDILYFYCDYVEPTGFNGNL